MAARLVWMPVPLLGPWETAELLRLSRLAESTRIQASQPSPDAGSWWSECMFVGLPTLDGWPPLALHYDAYGAMKRQRCWCWCWWGERILSGCAELDGSNKFWPEACGCFAVWLVCGFVAFCLGLCFWRLLQNPGRGGGFYCKLSRGGDCWFWCYSYGLRFLLELWTWLPVLWPCIVLIISCYFLRWPGWKPVARGEKKNHTSFFRWPGSKPSVGTWRKKRR